MGTDQAVLLALAVTVATALASCGGDSSSEASETKVVATTTHVADLARNVAGERAGVLGVLSANSDPHEYEPSPSDAEAFGESELILKSGGDFDVWVDEVAESAGGEAEVVELFDSAATIEGGDEHAREEHSGDGTSEDGQAGEEPAEREHGAGDDPHWWQDPENAIAAVETIRDELVAVDPEGEQAYTENADAYIERLTELDREVAACMAQVPDDQRKLVTTHDALGYFAEAYDVEVIGAAIPALTTQAQPSAGETAELVDLIEEEDVRAVFPESGVNPGLEEAIAEETGATIGEELWADTLGPEGSSGETYAQAMAHNAVAMAEGFSGGEISCEISAAR